MIERVNCIRDTQVEDIHGTNIVLALATNTNCPATVKPCVDRRLTASDKTLYIAMLSLLSCSLAANNGTRID